MSKKIIALVTEPISADVLRSAVGRENAQDAEVLVVAPALNSRKKFLLSDSDEAIARAEQVQEETVERLDEEGIDAVRQCAEFAIRNDCQMMEAADVFSPMGGYCTNPDNVRAKFFDDFR